MLDLPLKGNLGKEKEEGLILLIKNMKEVEILIDKNEIDMHYQESKKVREYVKNSICGKCIQGTGTEYQGYGKT